MRAGLLAVLLMALNPPATAQDVPFSALVGWENDDHLAALKVFQTSCQRLKAPEWAPVCKLADQAMVSNAAAKAFFEMLFQPKLIGDPPALFTGYYEPELQGSARKTGPFRYPIYKTPADLVDGQAYLTRAQIEAGALSGKGLELAWLADPVDVFFLHIQGSGRIVYPDGKVMRVGYAARNGYAYKSIGQELVRRGTMQDSEVSAARIRNYVKANPTIGTALLNENPSYIFFRKVQGLDATDGPIGAMSLPITAMRSIAADPEFVTLGAPVWIEKQGASPMNRLMVAQDTGGAIKGAQRADIFFGTGTRAGDAAGTIRDAGRMIQLLPHELAYTPTPNG
jgi:membrane-bound lytic murein transglycosylase A